MPSVPDPKKDTLAVYVLSRPSFGEEIDRFLRDQDIAWRRDQQARPAEELIEFSGRLCYLSFGARQSPRTNEAYIRNLIEKGHDSVLEHAVWTFLLSGISRGFTHQLVRHRVGVSFSQLSQQYHDESDAKFVMPAELGTIPTGAATWSRVLSVALQGYREIVAALRQTKAPSGLSAVEWQRAIHSAARSLLPNATATAIVVTANARALRHFLSVRGDILGDDEMRRVAAALFREVVRDAPAVFSDFVEETLPDRSPVLRRGKEASK
jgi:thymidylate synthase (FAD)